MKRAHHFRITARLDMASRLIQGTVTIDPRGTFIVRPHRRRRTYELPLDQVADMVVKRLVAAELLRSRLEKAKRRGRR